MSRDRDNVLLKDAIKELVQENSLESDELGQLKELSETQPAIPSRRRWLAVAAGMGAVSMAGIFGVNLIGVGNNAYAMAEEIASNHLRPAPLDVESASLDELRREFAGLGFSLVDAAQVENVPGQLLGGRFCSVASTPAARLTYLDSAGPITVYQSRFDERHHQGAADMDRGEPGNVIYSRGVKVCLCHTRGVLLATASGSGIS